MAVHLRDYIARHPYQLAGNLDRRQPGRDLPFTLRQTGCPSQASHIRQYCDVVKPREKLTERQRTRRDPRTGTSPRHQEADAPARIRRIILISAVLALAVGCSQAKPASDSSKLTAGQVTIRMSAHIKSIAAVADYTAATDDEHLLGRPGGYLSKTLLTDNRVSDSGKATTLIDHGGIVEVFADGDAAAARVDSLRKTVTNRPGPSEYDYLQGPIVLRVSKLLTPSQAAEYQKALTGIG